MKLQTAQRKRAKIKLGLQGPSGSGKTYSSLLVAYGLTTNWETIAVVDTENHSAELYSHLGPFKVLPLSNPYIPEKYIEAIDACTKEGMEVIILDSITHEWENLIDFHASIPGNTPITIQPIEPPPVAPPDVSPVAGATPDPIPPKKGSSTFGWFLFGLFVLGSIGMTIYMAKKDSAYKERNGN